MYFDIMKSLVVLAGCLIAGISALNAQAGEKLRINFHGTSTETNANGAIVVKSITEKNWLQQYVNDAGLADSRGLAVVFNEQGDPMGDTSSM